MPNLTFHRIPALILSLLTPLAHLAAEDLTNAAVTGEMNGGDSTYILDDYSANWGQIAASVGNTTSNNTLTIQNGATAANTGTNRIHTAIGRIAGSNNNEVIIQGVGSSWSFSGGSFYVGFGGNNNRLEVLEGATFNSGSGIIGGGSLTVASEGQNNSALIDGAGSTWNSTGSINVGSYGAYSSLTISNGGALSSSTAVIGNGNSSVPNQGSNNTATITGAFSTFTTSGRTTIGNNGSDNTMIVSAGAAAYSQQIQLGYGASFNPNAGLRNSLLITGAESSYTVQSDMAIGLRGSNNTITVENGARLSNDDNPETSGYLFVGRGEAGYLDMGRQNSAIVQGTGSVWNNSNIVVLGEYGSENSIIVRDGATFTSGSMIIGQYDVTVGGGITGMNNELLVTGANSVWQNVGSVAIGSSENEGNSGNRIVVQDRGLAMLGDGLPTLEDVPDTLTVALGNKIRIDGGYIALFGDQQAAITALIDAGAFQVLQGGIWTDATSSDIQFAYFATGADTSSFTAGYYDNLGGYTVVTAVPEPSTAVLLFGALVVGLWMLRRRSARA